MCSPPDAGHVSRGVVSAGRSFRDRDTGVQSSATCCHLTLPGVTKDNQSGQTGGGLSWEVRPARSVCEGVIPASQCHLHGIPCMEWEWCVHTGRTTGGSDL